MSVRVAPLPYLDSWAGSFPCYHAPGPPILLPSQVPEYNDPLEGNPSSGSD